jgi:hypothetical protein
MIELSFDVVDSDNSWKLKLLGPFKVSAGTATSAAFCVSKSINKLEAADNTDPFPELSILSTEKLAG